MNMKTALGAAVLALATGGAAAAQQPSSPWFQGSTPQAAVRQPTGYATGPLQRLSARAQDTATAIRPDVRRSLQAQVREAEVVRLADLRRGELNGQTLLCGEAVLRSPNGAERRARFIGHRTDSTLEDSAPRRSFAASWRHVGCSGS